MQQTVVSVLIFCQLLETGVFFIRWHFSVYRLRYLTERWRKKNWWTCGIAHITFLNRLAHIKVYSQAIVLNVGGTFWFGLYNSLHFVSTWFRKWSLSITFEINFQASLKGSGSERSNLDILRLSKWHMLSYDKQIEEIACLISSSECTLNFLLALYKVSINTQCQWKFNRLSCIINLAKQFNFYIYHMYCRTKGLLFSFYNNNTKKQ